MGQAIVSAIDDDILIGTLPTAVSHGQQQFGNTYMVEPVLGTATLAIEWRVFRTHVPSFTVYQNSGGDHWTLVPSLSWTMGERRQAMLIRVDDLQGPEIARLLRAHLENCRKWSPPESIHALDLDCLRAPDITFWSAWDSASLLGCGALKELDPSHGEIKSMHTAEEHRGRGVATGLLAHIVDEARSRCYARLSLETGSMEAFAPARALYARFGFVSTGPFGDYVLDPNSCFMTLDLTGRRASGGASKS